MELPVGWAMAPLSDLVPPDGIFTDGDWVETKDQDPSGDVRLTQLADVGDGIFRDRSNRSMTHEKATELRCTFLQKGDILVARMPDPLGRACLYPGSSRPAVTVVDVCVIRTGQRGVDNRWLMWAINSPRVRQQIHSYQTGTTRKRISRKNLEKVELAVPPLAEQHRIVEALEDHLSRLDAGVAGVALAQAKAKRFISVLHGRAVSGGLSRPVCLDEAVDEASVIEVSSSLATRRWKPVPFVSIPGYRPPENWTTVSLGTLSHASGYGTSTKCDYEAPGYPVLRIPNVQGGSIDLSDIKNAIDPGLDLTKFSLDPGDLLFVRTNGSPSLIGRVGVVEKSLPYAFASYLIRFRLTPGVVEPRWVQLVTQSPLWRRAIEKYAASSAGQYNLSAETLSQLPVPIPPLDVQRETLEEVEAATSGALRLSAASDVAMRRSDRLRTAVLQRAFTGRLVPQDPTDEPASVLLDRIRTEREAQADKPKRANRRPRKAATVEAPPPPSAPSSIDAVQQELPL
ncbi:restriction endonuclease subunit S [Streptomyces sp. NPDC001743]|uniref:restriction endonuclease subunit S n=1 Tax=Streptomyces sp. NPDC001743 TaxID=3154397 RepID=UPI00331959EA